MILWKKAADDQKTSADIRLILEDIRTTVDHAIENAEFVMNQNDGKVIELEKD